MHKPLLAIITFLFLQLHLNAQENCFTVNKAYPNSFNKSLLENYPDIDSIEIRLVQEKPTDLHIWYKPGAAFRTEWFDWEFEGDIYLFKNKFPKADLPVLPKVEINYMAGLKKCNTSTDYFLNAVVHRDSVQYKFSQCCPSDTDWIPIRHRSSLGAYYNSDISELSKLLGKQYDKNKHQPAGDSVLIFRAIVGAKNLNNLQNIELITGTRSAFSDFIQQGLVETGASWLPASQSGRQVKYYIRIFARLNSDGSITMSTK